MQNAIESIQITPSIERITSDDITALTEITALLNSAGGGLLPRTVDDIARYANAGEVYAVRDENGRIVFTFSIEPGATVELPSGPLTIWERGAMAIASEFKGQGMALQFLQQIYATFPELYSSNLLVTSLNPAVWFNNLSTGFVPLKLDESSPEVQRLILWTCVCSESVTLDAPTGIDTNTVFAGHPCLKRPRIGENLVYPIQNGRFTGGSDVIFVSPGLFEILSNYLGDAIQDATVDLFMTLWQNARSDRQQEKLGMLAQMLVNNGYQINL